MTPAGPARISVPVVKVGDVRSDQSCDVLAANWRWVLVECDQQFPKLRTALQSALLDSRKVRLSTARAGHDNIAPDLMPIWTILDTTPEGRGKDWYPKLSYQA